MGLGLLEITWLDALLLSIISVASLIYFYVPPQYLSFKFGGSKNAQKGKQSAASQQHAAHFSPSGFLEKMERLDKKIIIFFGSQTGTAEGLASELAKEAAQYGLGALVADLMDYDMEDLKLMTKDRIVFFVLATYGEGEPTDNAMEFHEWLMSDELEEGCLSGLRYCVFGLGNKTYTKFNEVARVVDKRLKTLGAIALTEKGEGDDDGNMEEDFVQWKEKMWKDVCGYLSINPDNVDTRIIRSYSFKKLNDYQDKAVYKGEHGSLNSWNGNQSRVSYNQQHPYYAPLIAWRSLYKEGLTEKLCYGDGKFKEVARECLHLEFDISGTSLRYQTGDHFGVYPENDPSEVEKLAEALGITEIMDTVFEMRVLEGVATSKKSPFPVPTTIRAALTYYLDISSPPKMSLLGMLSKFATDAKEASHLKGVSTKKEEYHEYIVHAGRNLTEVLNEHNSFRISLDDHSGQSSEEEKFTLGDLFEVLPRLQPRFYSISSSAKTFPNTVHVTASVLKYCTSSGRLVTGVTTGYFKRLTEKFESGKGNLRAPVFIRSSKTFHLPRNLVKPVVMVGPGTGIAPFRGFVQERATLLKERIYALAQKDAASWASTKPLHPHRVEAATGKLVAKRIIEDETIQSHRMMGETILFFGSRNREHDFLYSEELIQSELHHGLTSLYAAFSREQDGKTYVQHLMKNDGETIWNVLYNKEGVVYVCGDGRNMSKDIHSTILDLAKTYGGLTESAAISWLEKKRKNGQYFEDVWS